jgi:hypothetical protein
MITITELELVLFIGFAVMTFLYFKIKAELLMHKRITAEIFMRIAKGEIKVHETEDGFDLEPTAKKQSTQKQGA